MQKISKNIRYFVKHKFYNIYSYVILQSIFFRIIYRDRLWLLFLKKIMHIYVYTVTIVLYSDFHHPSPNHYACGSILIFFYLKAKKIY